MPLSDQLHSRASLVLLLAVLSAVTSPCLAHGRLMSGSVDAIRKEDRVSTPDFHTSKLFGVDRRLDRDVDSSIHCRTVSLATPTQPTTLPKAEVDLCPGDLEPCRDLHVVGAGDSGESVASLLGLSALIMPILLKSTLFDSADDNANRWQHRCADTELAYPLGCAGNGARILPKAGLTLASMHEGAVFGGASRQRPTELFDYVMDRLEASALSPGGSPQPLSSPYSWLLRNASEQALDKSTEVHDFKEAFESEAAPISCDSTPRGTTSMVRVVLRVVAMLVLSSSCLAWLGFQNCGSEDRLGGARCFLSWATSSMQDAAVFAPILFM
eukprot:CAMPEP_0203908144 /NCGR_PEP_ID=MMETSP0359-20131031/49566_1 /ASSEMBLY_ACC=CAM_ASM_000338 /TAXON_ID=268821 /ORGANISM="Scrippsiella Hangoei, Strain SHTV-5" /LENGTH=326 /DNA_ID=CAMNT_0050833085 /DNA_START=97 /DNA_END=1077 /DNA_ORIENTATION=+